jgi:excisionase family DNA binding protein
MIKKPTVTRKLKPAASQASIAKAETAIRAAARHAFQRKRGYITVNEAAVIVNHPRSNIYHWIVTGELRKEQVGAGRGSVYVCLEDLRKKFPQFVGPLARVAKASARA